MRNATFNSGEHPALFKIKNGTIRGPDGELLNHLNLEIPDRAITAILGPAGTGKSMFVRALSGLAMPDRWLLLGSWFHRGTIRRPASQEPAPWDGIVFQPQNKLQQAAAKEGLEPGLTVPIEWPKAFRQGAQTIILDEPEVGLLPEQIIALTNHLREHRDKGGAIVVTHNLAFAESIADFAVLLCAGKVEAQGWAPDFFNSPPSALASHFIRQGNCWPISPSPMLPSHFHWILPEKLAGMGCPGLLRDVDEDLRAIAGAGITLLVSLTEEAFSAAMLRSYGIDSRHFPIGDMDVPSLEATAILCEQVERDIENGHRVAFHCFAGLGRTGTMLAALLVWQGHDPDDVITYVRSIRSGFIQTAAQEEFVSRFGNFLRPQSDS